MQYWTNIFLQASLSTAIILNEETNQMEKEMADTCLYNYAEVEPFMSDVDAQ